MTFGQKLGLYHALRNCLFRQCFRWPKLHDAFKVKDERQQSQQVDQARKQETKQLNVEAKRGDKKAQQQMRQLEQQQKREARAQDLIRRTTSAESNSNRTENK